MRYGHAALMMIDDERLGIVPVIDPGRAVSDVSDGDAPPPQAVQYLGIEDVVHEPLVLI